MNGEPKKDDVVDVAMFRRYQVLGTLTLLRASNLAIVLLHSLSSRALTTNHSTWRRSRSARTAGISLIISERRRASTDPTPGYICRFSWGW